MILDRSFRRNVHDARFCHLCDAQRLTLLSWLAGLAAVGFVARCRDNRAI